jgi:hypothetical protein
MAPQPLPVYLSTATMVNVFVPDATGTDPVKRLSDVTVTRCP